MVKKVSASKKAVISEKTEAAVEVDQKKAKYEGAVEQAKDNNDVDEMEVELNGDESQTIKQKKENAKRMLQAVKKFNAKLKSTLERKQIVKAVQALQAYQAAQKAAGAKKTQNLLEAEDQFI